MRDNQYDKPHKNVTKPTETLHKNTALRFTLRRVRSRGKVVKLLQSWLLTWPHNKTRMHSSRMRTVRSSGRLSGEGVSAPGVWPQGGVCSGAGGAVCSGGVSALGGCLLQGVWSQGGVCSGGLSALGEGVCSGGVCSGGGCLLWGGLLWRGVLLWGAVCSGGRVSAPGGVCSGGGLLWGGLLWRGVSALGGCLLWGEGVCSGGCVSHHALRQTPPCGQTDACKKHNLPNFGADGNKIKIPKSEEFHFNIKLLLAKIEKKEN